VVVGGMLAATCVSVCLIPVTFYVVENIASRRRQAKSETVPNALHGETPGEASP
jgi:uncharacterized protein (DUF2062 family)